MTNGPGKSDRPTVPGKSPNNAGQPAAEGMEGKRSGLEGNLLEQNASRTPSQKMRLARSSGYVKQQRRISSCGSRRFCTTSTTWKRCAWLTSD